MPSDESSTPSQSFQSGPVAQPLREKLGGSPRHFTRPDFDRSDVIPNRFVGCPSCGRLAIKRHCPSVSCTWLWCERCLCTWSYVTRTFYLRQRDEAAA